LRELRGRRCAPEERRRAGDDADQSAARATRPGSRRSSPGQPRGTGGPETMEVGDVMIGQRERNRCHLELWDAFHLKGCPVCDCIGNRVMRRVRETLDGAPGKNAPPLCAYHTRVLAAGHDEYGSAAALRFIRRVEALILDALDSHKERPGVLGLVKTVFTGREMPHMETELKNCFACRLEGHEERKTLAVLLDALTDPDFHRAFRESDGLCMRHLCGLSHRFSGRAVADMILREQLRKLEELRDAFAASRFRPNLAGIPDDPAAWERFFMLMGKQTEQSLDVETESMPTSGEGAGSLPSVTADEPNDLDDGPDAARFEKEKWRRARETLQRRLNEESTRAAALHYRYWKTMEDNKTLQMNLAGARAMARSLQEQVDRLKEATSVPFPKGDSSDRPDDRSAG
jgi:hypothetical protein